MTLEDFFTLTEMKDGLATLFRVEELLSVMRKQKDCVVNNVGDAARQWSTVASILATTENKDCLDYFMQLNGLWFLNHWLQEAQKWIGYASDNSIEELINTLLGALEKLPADEEKSSDCGLRATFQELLSHRSLNVQERVRSLLDKWNPVKDDDSNCQNLDERVACHDDEFKLSADVSMAECGKLIHSAIEISPSKDGTGEGSHKTESSVSDSLHPIAERCSDGSESDTVKVENISSLNQITPPTKLNTVDANIVSADVNSLGPSLVSNPGQGTVFSTEERVCCAGVLSTGTCSSPTSNGRNIDDHPDVSHTKDTLNGSKEMEVKVILEGLGSCKFSQEGMGATSSSSGLTASPVHVQKALTESGITGELDTKESQSCMPNTSELQPKGGIVDYGIPKYPRTTKEPKPAGSSQDSFGNGRLLRKASASENSFRKDGPKAAGDIQERGNDPNMKVNIGVDSMISSASLMPTVDTSTVNEMDRRISEMGLEYGEFDALEVARQVAIEVEREVVDYREPCCSSSPSGNSEGEIMDSSSPDIAENKHKEPMNEHLNGSESPTGKDLSDISSPKENSSIISENNEVDLKEPGQELESPKSTSVQESTGNMDKGRCNFDLNEDVCAEETDCPMVSMPNQVSNLSAPIPVAASKGAPGLPVTAFHFEGESGWRGSAATSAFRPASSRRTPDGEKTVSGPKQKSNFLNFDLNLAGGEGDGTVDPILDKQIPVSSGLPSGDSSVEVSSRRAERLKLDLNRLGDEDTMQNQSSYWRLHHQYGNHSPSPVSSSSSRQPSMRDIDLNDNPSFVDACGSHSLSKSSSKDMSTYGNFKVDDPAITIMGSRMSVERKEPVSQTLPCFQGNGLSVESTMGARPSLPYPHMATPAYGYNGLTMGPPMSLSPAFYAAGPFPYMIDSRGATVIPQILGSSAGMNGPPSSRPTFLMSVTGAPSGLNVAAVSRPSLDLNSGISHTEGGAWEVGGSKQLFLQASGGIEEQMRSALQPTGSSVAVKRKEPDCGWEPYTMGYKNVAPWQ